MQKTKNNYWSPSADKSLENVTDKKFKNKPAL